MPHFMAIQEGGGGPQIDFCNASEIENRPPFHGWLASEPLDPSLVPNEVHIKGAQPIRDAFGIGFAGCVSPRLQLVLEAAEPNVHQFFPLHASDGNVVAYIFHVTQSADCVLATESQIRAKGVVKHGPQAGHPYYLCHDDGLTISRPARGSKKILSATTIAPGSLIVPDCVANAVSAQSMTGLRMYPAGSSDTPWVMEEQAPELAQYLSQQN